MIHPLGIISLITTADKYDDGTFNKWYSIFCHQKINWFYCYLLANIFYLSVKIMLKDNIIKNTII